MNGEELLELADRVAGEWTGFPHLRDDLKAQAALAMCKALANFDPQKGKLTNYLLRAGHFTVTRYVAKNAAPVSFPRRATFESLTPTKLPPMAAPEDPPDVQVAKNRFREDVRERLLYLVGAEGAQLLLSEGDQTDEEYLTWRRARYRIQNDRKLQALWKERTE
jgi:DNA-directed RNA polymerase specialized sigma subunit